MSENIDLHAAIEDGRNLAVLEDGRTVPIVGEIYKPCVYLRYAIPGGDRRMNWAYRQDGRWLAEQEDVDNGARLRHPRVVATLSSAPERHAVNVDGPDHLARVAQATLQPGDYVLLDDLDGPDHLARVAQAMLNGYPHARRNCETPNAFNGSDWRIHGEPPLALTIDPRHGSRGEVWCVPQGSDAVRRRRTADDVLHAAGPRRANGYRVVQDRPAPDDNVGVTFTDTSSGRVYARTVQAVGRDTEHDEPCVWLDGDHGRPFRWTGDRYCYAGRTDTVLVWPDDHDEED